MAGREPVASAGRLEIELGAFDAELELIDAMAYAVLIARRLGYGLVFSHCQPQLEDLVTLCGLDDVLTRRPPPRRGAGSGSRGRKARPPAPRGDDRAPSA